jgi:hypothetical protein
VKIKTFRSILIIMFLYAPALAADSNSAGQNANKLPWEIIAEKFNTKKSFSTAKSRDANSINYALDPNVSIITLPSNVKLPKEKTEAELSLSKWQENLWAELSPITVQIDSNGLAIDINAIAEGFYTLLLIFDKNDIGKESNNFYAVVAADWKKDLLAWCKKNKEQIETNPDPQLIYSSIAVSHFDNLMELAGKSSSLSEKILSALAKAITAKTSFEDGNCPDLVIGLNKIRLKRFEGASVAEFVILFPEIYDNLKKWPMLVYADTRRVGAMSNYKESSSVIILWWHFPTPLGYEWKDYKCFLDIISDKINLDKNRIYVNGECGNGITSVDLGLKYPDQWAECSASLGNASRQLAGNALNLPLIFVKGEHNEDWAIGYYDFAVECFKYHGCRYFKHGRDRSINDVRGKSVPDAIRDISPARVLYAIESFTNPQAYWVQIGGREDENFIASIDAIVWGQSILVKTDNVDAYTLNLEQAPLDCNRPVEIIENGKHIDFVTGAVFTRKSSKYENALYIKNKSLNGPVADVFTDQYVAVWTGDEKNEKFAMQIAGTGPCFADVNLPASFLDTHNIVFVGRLEKSKYFKEITDKLPAIIEDGKLTADGQVYEGDFGVIFIYPNPLNAGRYIAVFSGTSDKALNLVNTAWGQIKSSQTADVGIFEAADSNQVKWLRTEKFDTVWGWHKSWDVPLAKLAKTYPKWKWRQWVARVLREQLGTDVMISEEPFSSAELPDKGELTLRDISRIFKNDWIVKISLKGRDLRELLTVPFNDISSGEVCGQIIDGVSLVKQTAKDIICINELDNDKLYTIALPYKAVNGKRMGMVMKNYRLDGVGFLVVLLRDYLKKNNAIDLDAELVSMQLNIF